MVQLKADVADGAPGGLAACGDFGPVSGRFIGKSARKTSLGTGIIYIHSYQ